MTLKADEARKYYRLLKTILSDLRVGSKWMFRPEEKYQQAYENIKVVHLDYVDFFGKFLERIKREHDPKKIISAKRNFMTARRRQSDFRLISKVDAHAYLANVNDITALRFLTAVIWYLSYSATSDAERIKSLEILDIKILMALNDSRIGEGAWDSSSDSFWHEIENIENTEELEVITKRMLSLITERYALLERTFRELPKGSILPKPQITETKYTNLVRQKIEQRKFEYTLEKE